MFKKYSILILGLFLVVSCNGPKPEMIGILHAGLLPCTDDGGDKCLSSSNSPSDERFIEPLKIDEPVKVAFDKLEKLILNKYPGKARIIRKDPRYIHAEFTSSIFQVIRDVEFFAPKNGNMVQVKCHSRGNLPDLGKSRSLLEEIKFKYVQNDVN